MVHIVDYDAGNQTSVKRALDYLGVEAVITPDAETIRKAERLIFPGVGHAHSAMETLKEHGLDEALKDAFHQGTPILGICVGCQILLSRSDETDLPCLDLIDGACHRFQPSDHALKVPHMGWNALSSKKPARHTAGTRPRLCFFGSNVLHVRAHMKIHLDGEEINKV